ncbi:hypothetical protein PR202_gb06074 [Eleusine coracana subsp. coracana]|uniref:Uncharacterized protein n=1 Tax=Eleusine coracana subsp. coracana TaxID=191504 RepID=A0AAV5E9D5_ELECO|nr:hypothetical protein QOZ80_2BG0153420 [Eleusine coracana subsp. coracana]GJN18865.1 hypothetical protein PR202_gb06074 [Eleusine coracana subsp. coracana]
MVRRLGEDDAFPTPDPTKTSWPEVVGWDELPAGIWIANDRREVTVQFLNLGETRPPGYNPRRVIVFVDATLHVALTPLLG